MKYRDEALRCARRHSAGFYIFLPPDRLRETDEYASGDPYNVEEEMHDAFQRRRFDLTLELLRLAAKDVGDAPTILDLGCGEGHITHAMAVEFPRAQISGLDYSISAVAHASRQFPTIEFAVADAMESPYASDTFDIVVLNNLWEHVPDPLHLLAKIRDILKPNGFVIISTPSRYRLGNLVRVLLGKPVGMMSRHHVTEYTVGQIKEQLSFGGFNVVSMASRQVAAGLPRKLAKAVLSTLLSAVGSHHSLEATVFYLARMR